MRAFSMPSISPISGPSIPRGPPARPDRSLPSRSTLPSGARPQPVRPGSRLGACLDEDGVWAGVSVQFLLAPTGVLFQGVQPVLAGAFAAAGGLLADPAVLVVRGVPPAFIAAALADGHAGLQERPGGAGVVFGQAAEDCGGGAADVGAGPAQPRALDHLGQVRLAQGGVGVGG